MNFLFFLSSWAPVAAWAGLIYFLSSIPHLNSGLGIWDFILRKIAHVVEYAVLTLFLLRALKRTWTSLAKRTMLIWGGIAPVFYAMTDEFHQSFVPGRGPSVHDVLIDSVGVILILIYSVFFMTGCTPDRQMSRAQSLEKNGKIYEAWQAYQEFAADHPKHVRAPEALYHAGLLAQRGLKDCQSADVFYDLITEKYPQSDPWARLAANQKDNCPDYFPLLPGFQWVEGDSESKGQNARIEVVCKLAPGKDALPSEAGLIERTYYAGKTKFKSTQLLYKKYGGDVQESAGENDVRPKVMMKYPVSPGLKWKTRGADRTYTYEIVSIDKTIKVEAGEFSGCVLVQSSIEGVPGFTNEYYAPSVGKVLTAFATKEGEKRNTELLSYKPATQNP